MLRRLALVALLLCAARGADEEARRKAVRMRTTRQLKEIFDELDIPHAGLDKEVRTPRRHAR